jgi:hypothetical protein
MVETRPTGMYILSSWKIKDGKLQLFKKVIERMVREIKDRDDDAVAIDYYLNHDAEVSYGVEYYRTPESYAEASVLVKKWVPGLDEASEATNIWVLGDTDVPAVKKVLEPWAGQFDHGIWFFGFRPDLSDEIWERLGHAEDPHQEGRS